MRSAVRFVAACVKMHTVPCADNFAMISFPTTSPGPKFNDDAVGRSTSHGYTVKNPTPDGRIAVTFNTTADAPSGTPPRPDTCTVTTPPAATSPNPSDTPSTVEPSDPPRESTNRAGVTETIPPDESPPPPFPPPPFPPVPGTGVGPTLPAAGGVVPKAGPASAWVWESANAPAVTAVPGTVACPVAGNA